MTKPESTSAWTEKMRCEWEERARRNARYFICTDVPDEEKEFYDSGERDYARYVTPFVQKSARDPRQMRALEIGCGIGRMTACFARDFQEVVGVDISATMVERARQNAPANAQFIQGNGCDLTGIPDSSVDFVFSYIVFQHIPERAVVLRYIEETGRVLRSEGIFLVHLNGLKHLRLGRTVLEVYISESPKLRKVGLRKLPWIRRRNVGTWMGHPVRYGEARRACEMAGLRITNAAGRGTVNMWIGGNKV